MTLETSYIGVPPVAAVAEPYKILTDDNPDALSQRVNQAVADGYYPAGSLVVVTFQDGFYLFQPVTRYVATVSKADHDKAVEAAYREADEDGKLGYSSDEAWQASNARAALSLPAPLTSVEEGI